MKTAAKRNGKTEKTERGIGAGTAIAWRRRGLFLFSALIGFLTASVRWLALWPKG
jgi:hypothetical protein